MAQCKESTCQSSRCRFNLSFSEILLGSTGEGNGNPHQYSCLGNLMDRGSWRAAVHGVTKESDMTQRLINNNNKEVGRRYSREKEQHMQ